ncbi:NAD(P)/FAD-dependent oxidoreductase [Aeromicrobium sp. Marseille-Q0843]|uniref:Pyridine nucleotide-disulfide oxidoreductase domain-containing protein 2 n=1 Tax=Aeromicrobium phoceense TaxID=2754045 RepID=A0A838XMU7_9ACTN|nr:NAD(P)/FAD-dependent oxidoreductase [Aeromicrobium phoceense]MBA4608180.1 NAD(P)/FAD-dependent oxidoreductase [Aeromicrobium phoceense]
MSTHDAIVIGAGPNGLVAANHLIDAGWSVLVLEEQDTVGGAVRSDSAVQPGFVHDTFSTFYPLAAASRTIQGFHLEEHGLVWRHAPAVLGHPFPDGSWALLHRDRAITAALMEQQQPGDGDAWLELCAAWDTIGDALITSLLTPFPPVRGGLSTAAKLPRVGGMDFVKTLLSPVIDLADARFRGPSPALLLAGNSGHADIPLDAPGSGLMGLMLTMLGQTVGFPVPEGGAGMLTQAMARRLESLGGRIETSTRVAHIDVAGGRATGVRTADGEHHTATRAVIADVIVTQLYGDLLDPADVPARVHRRIKDFRLDPGTVKVDWALDGPIPWATPPLYAPGTFHVADSRFEMNQALQQVHAGRVPAHPFLLAGQMTTTDPTRSPAGTESVWAYTHVPQKTVADAGDGSIRGTWDHDDVERFADRMQARIEALAPGFGSRILKRRVLGPRELEARDANLVGGAINGGTAQLHQQLVFRPTPGLGRAETPIGGLYLGSASAHPGGGVHGAPGMNAARAALAHGRVDAALAPLRGLGRRALRR